MKFWSTSRCPGTPEEQLADGRASQAATSSFNSLVLTADAATREQLSSVLRARGHRTAVCSELAGLGAAMHRAIPDLVLIDWRLPQGDTAAALELIDTHGGPRPCTVVALVEARHLRQPRTILERGVDDMVAMPLDEEDLDLRLSVAERRVLTCLLHPTQPARAEDEAAADVGPHDSRLRSALWEWNLDTCRMEYSADFAELMGDSAASKLQTLEQWLERVHPTDREQLRVLMERLGAGDERSVEQCVRVTTLDGRPRQMLIQAQALLGDDPAPHRVVGRQTDVTDDDGRLLEGCTHLLLDPLTKLAGRAVLMDRLRHACARAARPTGRPFAVLFFDLDRFKNVNDGLGHRVGDLLLCAIADRVRTICRPSDTVCRFGGDEFVLVAEDVDTVRQATAIADRLHGQFVVPFEIEGADVYASISTGISMWHEGYEDHEDLLRDADNAMARAKALGRNRYAVFDSRMHAEVVAILELENDLRRAVARGEFRTYYQPIVVLESGRLAGFEALVRWQHPERGLLLPSAFIAVAEEMGVAVQLDRIVAEEACRQLRVWEVKYRPDPPLTMSLNISTTQFLQPDLVSYIDRTLRQNGLYGSSIKLEVTESVLMEHTAHASAMLDQLRAIDIAISIDDFGTGYSSLSYLRRFEIDTLKIDYSFVSRMLEDESSTEIVRTIANLAKNLGKETVAEGAETRSQLEMLSDMGVDRVQGFFIAPPLPAEEIEKILELVRYEDNHLEAILFDRLHPEIQQES